MSLQDELIRLAKANWPTKRGLTLCLVIVLGTLLGAFSGVDLARVSLLEWVVMLAVSLAIVVVWLRSRFPRVQKGKIGFCVAIEYEDDDQGKQVRSDFILPLRELITSSRLRDDFSFMELGQAIARKISGDTEAVLVSQQVRTHFLLYGRARVRQTQGG